MRCLTALECAPIFGQTHLDISAEGHLQARDAAASVPYRLDGGPSDTERVGQFANHLIRWLPANSGRLLLLTDWGTSLGSCLHALLAMRRGIGEPRSIKSVPGHYFGPHPWTWDQLETGEEELADGEILVGMLILTMTGLWDGWLISEGSPDAIEFWEGNVIFYSHDTGRIAEAREILASLQCRMELI